MVVFWPIIKNQNIQCYKGIYNSPNKKLRKVIKKTKGDIYHFQSGLT